MPREQSKNNQIIMREAKKKVNENKDGFLKAPKANSSSKASASK